MNSYAMGNEYIYITHLPGLKKPVLAVGNGNVLYKVASFDSEEDAEGFSLMLGRWFGVDREVEYEDFLR